MIKTYTALPQNIWYSALATQREDLWLADNGMTKVKVVEVEERSIVCFGIELNAGTGAVRSSQNEELVAVMAMPLPEPLQKTRPLRLVT